MTNFQWPTNDSNRIGTLQKLRSPRVDTQVQPKEIDDWLCQSISLVAGSVRDLQRIRGESATLDLRNRMNKLRGKE
jgi:hypothetical protein